MNVYFITYRNFIKGGMNYTTLNAESIEEAESKFWSTRHPDLFAIFSICESKVPSELIEKQGDSGTNESNKDSPEDFPGVTPYCFGNEILSRRREMEGSPIGDDVFFASGSELNARRRGVLGVVKSLFQIFVRKKN